MSRALILELLSDTETEAVACAESSASLQEGEEYIDLGRLELGVQYARGAVQASSVLPRRAVRTSTWQAVLRILGRSLPRSRTSSTSR